MSGMSEIDLKLWIRGRMLCFVHKSSTVIIFKKLIGAITNVNYINTTLLTMSVYSSLNAFFCWTTSCGALLVSIVFNSETDSPTIM